MNEINEMSISEDMNYDDALLSISACGKSYFGINKIGDRKLRWNTDETRVNDLMEQYGRKVQTIHADSSSPRVSEIAEIMGMVPGMAFDITVNDPDDDQP